MGNPAGLKGPGGRPPQPSHPDDIKLHELVFWPLWPLWWLLRTTKEKK